MDLERFPAELVSLITLAGICTVTSAPSSSLLIYLMSIESCGIVPVNVDPYMVCFVYR